LLKRQVKHIAIGIAKIRRPGAGAGIGDGAAMGIAKFFTDTVRRLPGT